jgi:steroid delta-isomerase-like uncharacterized protein
MNDSSAMPPFRYPELMARWVAAINAEDVEGMLDCFTPDVEFEDVAVHRTGRGRAELEAIFKDWMAQFRETRARLLSASALGASGAAEWELTVTRADVPGERAADPAAHGPIRLRGACVDELASDGRIRGHRDYWNTADLEPR